MQVKQCTFLQKFAANAISFDSIISHCNPRLVVNCAPFRIMGIPPASSCLCFNEPHFNCFQYVCISWLPISLMSVVCSPVSTAAFLWPNDLVIARYVSPLIHVCYFLWNNCLFINFFSLHYNRQGACDEDNVHQLIEKWQCEFDDIIEFNMTYVDINLHVITQLFSIINVFDVFMKPLKIVYNAWYKRAQLVLIMDLKLVIIICDCQCHFTTSFPSVKVLFHLNFLLFTILTEHRCIRICSSVCVYWTAMYNCCNFCFLDLTIIRKAMKMPQIHTLFFFISLSGSVICWLYTDVTFVW